MFAIDPITALADELLADCRPPKDREANMRWREWARDEGQSNPELGEAFRIACYRDIVFWNDGFGWTLDTFKMSGASTTAPMILFRHPEGVDRPDACIDQEDMAVLIDECIQDRRSHGFDKSRGFGATWVFVQQGVRDWALSPDKGHDILFGSQKRDKVDGKGSDTIFGKVRFQLHQMSEWSPFLLPDGFSFKKHVNFMAVVNPVTGSALKGEARNDNFARSGRYIWVLLDEHAAIERADVIQTGVAGSSLCFFSLSTPRGLGTFQAEQKFGGAIPFLGLDWTSNPYLSEGIYRCEKGCPFHKDGGAYHSPWYDSACKIMNESPVKVAQELDRDYGKSGATVIRGDVIKAARALIAEWKPVFKHYRLEWEPPDDEVVVRASAFGPWESVSMKRDWKVKAEEKPSGPLRVLEGWEPGRCFKLGCACGYDGDGTGRWHDLMLGVDPARGHSIGNPAGAFIYDATARIFIAMWHGPIDDAMVFGLEMGKLSKWYGRSTGRRFDCAAAVESNGTGGTVIEVLQALGIIAVRPPKQSPARESRKGFGIAVSGTNKPKLLEEILVPAMNLVDASGRPEIIHPFDAFWKEAERFQWMETEKGSMTAQGVGSPDDLVMATQHTLHGVKIQYLDLWVAPQKPAAEAA